MPNSDGLALTKLALLIDGDNVRATLMPAIDEHLAGIGTVAIRRIYGQFSAGKMKAWEKRIAEFDLTPVNVSPARTGKNATDIALVIEAMDMLNGRGLDGICIASSDSDFTPLAERIRAAAVTAYGLGEAKAPKAYKDAFDRFFEIESVSKARTRASRRPRKGVKNAKSEGTKTAPGKPAVPEAEILAAIDQAKAKNGWARLGDVGKAVRTALPDFTAPKYGHRTMSGLVATMKNIELRTGADRTVEVRRR